MFRQLLDTDKNTDELKTDKLTLQGRTLKFAQSYVSLDNISLIEVIDLSTQRPIPTYFYVLGLIGLALFINNNTTIIGVVVLAALAFLVYQFWQKRVEERYGLNLITNSGRARILLAKDQGFLMDLAATLSDAISNPKITALVANFNSQKIDIGSMSGGVIATNVDGNVTQSNS